MCVAAACRCERLFSFGSQPTDKRNVAIAKSVSYVSFLRFDRCYSRFLLLSDYTVSHLYWTLADSEQYYFKYIIQLLASHCLQIDLYTPVQYVVQYLNVDLTLFKLVAVYYFETTFNSFQMIDYIASDSIRHDRDFEWRFHLKYSSISQLYSFQDKNTIRLLQNSMSIRSWLRADCPLNVRALDHLSTQIIKFTEFTTYKSYTWNSVRNGAKALELSVFILLGSRLTTIIAAHAPVVKATVLKSLENALRDSASLWLALFIFTFQ